MTVSFEKFSVYSKSLDFTIDIFNLLENENLKVEYAIKEQLKRATLSISNNIAEGSEYGNNRQFIRFLWIAKGSTAEVRNMLNILFKLNKIKSNDFELLYHKCLKISIEIYHFIKYLEKNIK
ncbi:MAG: four helix bundle protein [Bergeyella zoohelcum]|nr:four helix bundle protein [Bergeyella zoohelcum]